MIAILAFISFIIAMVAGSFTLDSWLFWMLLGLALIAAHLVAVAYVPRYTRNS